MRYLPSALMLSGFEAMTNPPQQRLQVQDLSVGFGSHVVQRELNFSVHQGSIFAIMGGSGCGKSTVLKAMIGLLRPIAGTVLVDGEDYWAASETRQLAIGRRFGVLFQGGALWSSLTVAENVALPLQMLAHLDTDAIAVLADLKLPLWEWPLPPAECRPSFRAGCASARHWPARLPLIRKFCSLTNPQPDWIRLPPTGSTI